MTTGSKLATATFLALAALSSLAPPANAAQCGNGPGGFEAWKREFAREAAQKASAPPRSQP